MKNRALSLLLCLLFALGAALPASAELVTAKAPAPKSIKLNAKTRTILPGGYYKLKATIKPANASKRVTWESSDVLIASVSADGLVIANAEGRCTITATTENGMRSASCVVTVGYAYGTAKVRFFGIANSWYKYIQPLDSPRYDLDMMMESVYSQARFQGKTVKRYRKHDLTGNGIRTTLKKMATGYGIKETDVTIFYYSGHGLADVNGSPYNGALCGVDSRPGAGVKPYVTVDEVRKYLDKVPGTVIVILDSCLSGQFIERKGIVARDIRPTSADTRAFTDAWVSSLSQSKASNFVVDKALTSSAKSYKYKILAGCAPMESSFLGGFVFDSNPGRVYPVSFLTIAFWDAAVKGPSSSGYAMAGDANGDRSLSLEEAYAYVRPIVYELMQDRNSELETNDSQTVTVWPANDPFPLASYTQKQ